MPNTIIMSIFILMIGSIFGSFISVLIYRIRTGKKGILLGRSMCPNCQKRIPFHHMIPVFSWVFLGGRCHNCKKEISSHYPTLEIATGLIFLTVFLKNNFLNDWSLLPNFSFILLESIFLILIFFYDLMYKEILDRFSLSAAGIALIGNILLENLALSSMLIAASVLVGFFLLQFLLSKGKWIGGGDLRMGLLMGVLLGWPGAFAALIIAYLSGSLVSVYLLSKKSVNRKSEIAFGPFLVLGTLLILFWGNPIINWYLQLFTI